MYLYFISDITTMFTLEEGNCANKISMKKNNVLCENLSQRNGETKELRTVHCLHVLPKRMWIKIKNFLNGFGFELILLFIFWKIWKIASNFSTTVIIL